MKNKDFKKTWILDVEADGPAPGISSMISFAIIDYHNKDTHFVGHLRPITERYSLAALESIGLTRQQVLAYPEAKETMERFKVWSQEQTNGNRPIIWSDNPGFDWGFLNYYCHYFWGENPFGWSCRRIGDFAAGLEKNPRSSNDWKKHRKHPHTHDPLDDVKGNRNALEYLMKLAYSQNNEKSVGYKK